eukprot:CAMPEP_0197022876 /NCGR_PEP_ID=MMETSP1384-20130603/3677_1 /TAXON_ID=29189 /ORGANISM="Ammonia sp." /LENGTH=480 /DNA_ID=CAMNT_0042450995 /DNA_START=37 /DNA_END=1479 /DNA_ORIENTATION=+
MLDLNGTPNTPTCSSNFRVELQETDGLIENKRKDISYTNRSPSAFSWSSLSSFKIQDNELAIILLGAAAGNFLEWFNFSVFVLMADTLGELFFPPSNPMMNLIQIYGLYGGVFLMRPIGGIIFGLIGDRQGRLQSLKLSIILMAVTTFITAVLPTYETIGLWATFLMIAVRLVQGLSIGGELTGALVYVVEVAPPQHQALFAILVQITGFGTLLGSAMLALLGSVLTPQQILSFGWRIPFIFGCLIGVFGVWARVYLTHDSPAFLKAQKHGDLVENPIKYAFATCKLRMLSVIIHGSFTTISYYVTFVWLPSYFTVLSKYTFNAFAVNVAAMILCAITAMISAHWVDAIKNMTSTKVQVTFGTIHIILCVVLFRYLDDPQDGTLAIIIWLILALTYGLYYGPAAAIWYIEMFPDVRCRNTAIGIGYNVTTAIFGGFSALAATAIATSLGGASAIGWWLFILGAISLGNDAIACYFNQRSK